MFEETIEEIVHGNTIFLKFWKDGDKSIEKVYEKFYKKGDHKEMQYFLIFFDQIVLRSRGKDYWEYSGDWYFKRAEHPSYKP